MHALGVDGLPPTVRVGDIRYRLEQTIKHDFFAATGFYVDDDGRRIVVKINRRKRFFGLPMRWIGRFLCRREMRAYQKLCDFSEIPALLGAVTETGFAHEYVHGQPLSARERVPDPFFDQLQSLIQRMAARGIAYVDLEKPENVLLGEDGRPHLIDFQIHFDSHSIPVLGRRLLGIFVSSDHYHALKLKRQLRPDQLTNTDMKILDRANFWIRFHRRATRPYFAIRRPLMRWLKSTGRVADSKSN